MRDTREYKRLTYEALESAGIKAPSTCELCGAGGHDDWNCPVHPCNEPIDLIEALEVAAEAKGEEVA